MGGSEEKDGGFVSPWKGECWGGDLERGWGEGGWSGFVVIKGEVVRIRMGMGMEGPTDGFDEGPIGRGGLAAYASKQDAKRG